ncbi:MAG TPA: dihydrolipoamide acetyltransferase family protein [Aggregatilineales bacterium]|nr:2-oxo acid dehydrogenase subunit E2 [Anaerolineales bacterium]HRE49421.1 dihydrolipoamide acetyltransferase family protein [Aggregatilineales bacterium]
MPTNVIMPQLGESVVEGTVGKWLKREGDAVAEFEPLCEVQTDKVDTEIPSPAAGVVLKIFVPEGKTVERGVLLAVIGQAGESVGDAPAPAAHGGHGHAAPAPIAVTNGNGKSESQRRYSPVVLNMAAEHGVNLNLLQGTGMNGRITKKDVEAYLAGRGGSAAAAPAPAALPPWEQPGGGDLFKPTEEIFRNAQGSVGGQTQPSLPAAPTPRAAAPAPSFPTPSGGDTSVGTVIPHTAIRRSIAAHMVQSKLHTAPHVTTVFEVDMSRVMAHWRANEAPYKGQGVRLTLTAYFITAMVKAAVAQPTLNAQWTDEGLFVPNGVHVGMAVALSDGLIVPVIRNAQDLSLAGIARQIGDLATRARAKQLKPDEIRGGTITLTNHGVSGSLFATPIINQPQSAIVGVGAVTKRPVVLETPEGDSLAIRPMMYVTLTFDHRVADGAGADAFLATFKKTLESWRD